MPDDRPSDSADPPESILGSLPRSRPGVRSPRRDAAARARAKARAPKASQKRPAADAAAEPGAADAGANLEDIARAGVTTGIQVAAAGLRLAGRTASAIRESLERR